MWQPEAAPCWLSQLCSVKLSSRHCQREMAWTPASFLLPPFQPRHQGQWPKVFCYYSYLAKMVKYYSYMRLFFCVCVCVCVCVRVSLRLFLPRGHPGVWVSAFNTMPFQAPSTLSIHSNPLPVECGPAISIIPQAESCVLSRWSILSLTFRSCCCLTGAGTKIKVFQV